LTSNRNQKRNTGAGPKVTPQAVKQAVAESPLAPTPAPDERQRLCDLLSALEDARESRVIAYWTTDMAKVSDAVVLSLYDQLSAIGRTPRLDLYLRTNGGQTEAPWRIVSLAREFCEELNVLVPHRAASAGTLIALGADHIVMAPLGVLGPIDPSRTHSLLPRREGEAEAEPVSVQDMRHAMQFIREAASSRKAGSGDDESPSEMPYTPDAMAQIFTALFDKIHPLAIGAIEQSYALSKLVGKQCLRTHMDPVKHRDAIQAIVDNMCDDYKSHQYPICRQEAREAGLKAEDATEPVERSMMDLFRFYSARPMLPQNPPAAGKQFEAHIAWLDSTNLQFRVEGNYVAGNGGELTHRGDQWRVY